MAVNCLEEVGNCMKWNVEDVDWGQEHLATAYHTVESRYSNIKILQLDKNLGSIKCWNDLQCHLEHLKKNPSQYDKLFIPLTFERQHERSTLLQFGMISIFRDEGKVVIYIPVNTSFMSAITVQELGHSLPQVVHKIQTLLPPLQWNVLQIPPDPRLNLRGIENTSCIPSNIVIVIHQIFAQINGTLGAFSKCSAFQAKVRPIKENYVKEYQGVCSLCVSLYKQYVNTYGGSANFDIFQEQQMAEKKLTCALKANSQANANLKEQEVFKDLFINELIKARTADPVLLLDQSYEKAQQIKELQPAVKACQSAQITLQAEMRRSQSLREIYDCLLVRDWFESTHKQVSIEYMKPRISALLAVILIRDPKSEEGGHGGIRRS